ETCDAADGRGFGRRGRSYPRSGRTARAGAHGSAKDGAARSIRYRLAGAVDGKNSRWPAGAVAALLRRVAILALVPARLPSAYCGESQPGAAKLAAVHWRN